MVEKLNDNLLEIIKKKEKTTTEFKKAKNKLPNTLFESICAMLNRNGGHIFLGVDDDGTILGIDEEYIPQMEKDLSIQLKISESTVKRNTNKLKKKGLLDREGSDKNGYWKIL